jgi:quercetin dioxygenase-like cupin family protein
LATGKRRYYHPQQKDYATFLETSEESGGERTLIEVEVAPDGGTPPHYDKTYEERFEVLEGELEVHVSGDARTLNVGQKASVPTNTLHNFRNLTDGPTTFLVELRPGSAGFEKALNVGYGLASDGRNPPLPPLLPGGAPGMVGYAAARPLHRRRAGAQAPGEAGPAQGDRPGAGGEVLPVGSGAVRSSANLEETARPAPG